MIETPASSGEPQIPQQVPGSSVGDRLDPDNPDSTVARENE